LTFEKFTLTCVEDIITFITKIVLINQIFYDSSLQNPHKK